MPQVNVVCPHARPGRQCAVVLSLPEMSLKILSCIVSAVQDIDSLGLGCEWYFMKSINSAIQLS